MLVDVGGGGCALTGSPGWRVIQCQLLVEARGKTELPNLWASSSELLLSMVEQRTNLFKSPAFKPSNISRASSLCPTSSNASVASCPPTSSKTSSPPLMTIYQPASCHLMNGPIERMMRISEVMEILICCTKGAREYAYGCSSMNEVAL